MSTTLTSDDLGLIEQLLKRELKQTKTELKTELTTEIRAALQQDFEILSAQIIGYLEPRFKSIEDRLDNCATKDQFNSLAKLIDAHEKRMETLEHEQTLHDHQISRVEGWSKTIAHKSGVNLEY